VHGVSGTTCSYACATQAGLRRLASNMTLTASVLVVFGSRRAMTVSSLPLRWDVVRLHHRKRCAQKPGPIAGSKLFTRDVRRELYDIFCNFVGSVTTPPWGPHAAVTQLALPPLRAEDSDVVLQAVPGGAQLPAALRQQPIAHGAGNSFFVEELAWHAVEHGGALTPMAIPETVHAVLAARIDQLPPEEKTLLQTASVIGLEVPMPLVQALAEFIEDTLQQGLVHLQAAELFYETRVVPERAFTFRHALTHEVAYGSLLQERRRTLHTRIVEALEGLSRDRVGDQAAAHYCQALALAEALGMRPPPGPLPPWTWDPVCAARPAGAGPRGTGNGHRLLPRHGDDVLAAPGRGGAGAGRGRGISSRRSVSL
jgi:hypothetical protein